MVDPGPAIQWKRNPSWTTSLLSSALHPPAPAIAFPRPRLHAIFSLDGTLTRQAKTIKQADIRTLTERVFTVDGNQHDYEDRRAKQTASVGRRLTAIAKEYTSSIHNVNEQPAEIRPVILLDIKEDAPWWDDLHSILRDHPAFPALKDDGGAAAGGGAAGGGAAVAGPGPAAMAHAAAGLGAVIDLLNDDTDDEDDAMQGVQYHYQKHPAAPPHHFPQPAAALQPHDLLAQQAAAFAFVANHAAALANPPPPPPPNPNLNPVAPPPLSPPPNPQPIPQSPEQTHCYNCQLVLDPATATEHMRRCFDGLEAGGELSGVFMSECIICKTDLEALSTRDRAKHIDECVSKGIIPEEFDVFVATERTRPQEKDGRHKECGMCLEDFESGERLVRLGCLCVFHEHCATAWWAPKADGKQGKFCMVHTEDAVK